MSETKSEGKIVGHSENFATVAKFCYGSENLYSENFAMCAKFSLCVIEKFFFFFEK